jgi:hypothetical protein
MALGRTKKGADAEASAETKEEQKQVATQQQQAQVSTAVADFEADAGVGQESMSRDDYAIPRLTIIQSLSPQLDKKNAAYLEDAEVGMIHDTVTDELWDGETGIAVIPVSYRRTHLEWKLRNQGGGFIADHGSDTSILTKCARDDKGNYVTSEGNYVVATAEYFVYLLNKQSGEVQPYVLSMAKSQLKKARRWNTMINQYRVARADGKGTFNPAMFYRAYKLTTVPESNAEGNWFGWSITPECDVVELQNGEQIYLQARQFREDVQSGKVQSKPPQQDAEDVEADNDPM